MQSILGRTVCCTVITTLCAFAGASTFTITPALNQPIAVAYSPVVNKLIFSQPFCGVSNRQLIAVTDTGQATLFANLPARVPTPIHASCWEDYVAVSPGFGGFKVGDVFVTQGQDIVRVPATGGSSAVFAHIPELTDTHTGITFDKVGTFGYQMLITGQNGKMYSVNSSGTYTAIADTTGLANQSEVGIENGSVAPLSWGAYAGWFVVSAEDRHKVFGVDPALTAGQHLVKTLIDGFEAPETIHFVPPILQNWGASGGVFFDIIFNFDNTTVVKFPASDFIPSYTNQAFIPQEENGQINLLYAFPTQASLPMTSIFTTGLGQQEGSTFVTQPTGCTLTIGGYKNNFSSKIVPLVLGGVTYTPAQILQILNTPVQGNGAISLAQQLIGAKLNVYYGAALSPTVAAAITNADALLAGAGSKIPPIGSATLPTSATSATSTILDNFNNGLLGPLHCQ